VEQGLKVEVQTLMEVSLILKRPVVAVEQAAQEQMHLQALQALAVLVCSHSLQG
jgi:hypothetical protein